MEYEYNENKHNYQENQAYQPYPSHEQLSNRPTNIEGGLPPIYDIDTELQKPNLNVDQRPAVQVNSSNGFYNPAYPAPAYNVSELVFTNVDSERAVLSASKSSSRSFGEESSVW